MKDKWKKILASVAPGLATALGGPAAGVAVTTLAKGLLGKPTATEDELAQAVESLPPDQYVRLRELEQDFQVKMAKLHVEADKMFLSDAADVRRQAVEESRNEDWFVRRARPAFGWIGVATIAWNYILGPVVSLFAGIFGAPAPVFQPINLPEFFWYTFMVWAVGYGYFRTRDKAGGAPLFPGRVL